MSRFQVIDSTLHGVTDYAVGATLMTVLPRAIGVTGTPSEKQIRAAGAVHVGYSTLTNYPLGLVKVLPYKAHLALDAVGAVGLAATPFITGQWKRGPKQWVPHLALCVFELTALALSDPSERGAYHGDVQAVREKNTADPHAQIYERSQAVRRPTEKSSMISA